MMLAGAFAALIAAYIAAVTKSWGPVLFFWLLAGAIFVLGVNNG